MKAQTFVSASLPEISPPPAPLRHLWTPTLEPTFSPPCRSCYGPLAALGTHRWDSRLHAEKPVVVVTRVRASTTALSPHGSTSPASAPRHLDTPRPAPSPCPHAGPQRPVAAAFARRPIPNPCLTTQRAPAAQPITPVLASGHSTPIACLPRPGSARDDGQMRQTTRAGNPGPRLPGSFCHLPQGKVFR